MGGWVVDTRVTEGELPGLLVDLFRYAYGWRSNEITMDTQDRGGGSDCPVSSGVRSGWLRWKRERWGRRSRWGRGSRGSRSRWAWRRCGGCRHKLQQAAGAHYAARTQSGTQPQPVWRSVGRPDASARSIARSRPAEIAGPVARQGSDAGSRSDARSGSDTGSIEQVNPYVR